MLNAGGLFVNENLMLDPLNVARMAWKFLQKKKSVGYSHAPITYENGARFTLLDDKGVALVAYFETMSCDRELDNARLNSLINRMGDNFSLVEGEQALKDQFEELAVLVRKYHHLR